MAEVTSQRSTKLALLFSVLLTVSLSFGWMWAAPADDYPHLRMGNPSKARPKADEADKDNFLMRKDFFALSYNNTKGTPNWVSWRLVKEDLGKAARKPFHPDSDLPEGFKKIVPHDYTGSGFDRGHMCPHSDRARTAESSLATFVMTNMVPQSPQNNQKAWDQLENYCRDLVSKDGKVCYIVDGPAGVGGVGRNGFKTKTPNGKVIVPAKTWKVVLVLDKDVADPTTMTADDHIRLFGVVVPNDDRVGYEWAGFRTPVKQIEELTGYKFFDKVPAALIDHLKDEHDEVPIPPPAVIHHGE